MLGYTFWHQLFVYSCDSCLLSSFMLLCSYPLVICLSCYLVILYLQLFFLLFCAHCVYARALPFTHTHLPGRFLTTLDLHVQILDGLFLLFRCLMRLIVCFAKSWSFSLFDSGILILLAFILFPDSQYIRFSCYSSHYLYDMRGYLYVIL